MDAIEKLQLLGPQMALEPAEEADGRAPAQAHGVAACGHSPDELRRAFEAGSLTLAAGAHPGAGDPGAVSRTQARKQEALGIYHAVGPGGRRMPLLKTLLTSACERDCYYCPFRAGRNYRRATFKPEEMARVFSQMQRAGMAEGLFLSSGIAGGGSRTQDRLLATAEILRTREQFRGYLHLKLMPGIERDQVLRTMQLADRVSINLEAPNSARLARLAPHKVFMQELLQPLQWAHEIRRTLPPAQSFTGRWPSLVTQFVVGAVGESDLEILTTTAYLTQHLRLQRAYFSAFRPVADTPLENQAPENPWREHRLYQSSFLLRDYGFDLEDLPFTPEGRLPLEVDPKLAWARQHLGQAPVDVNRASRDALLRVPGIGLRGADVILQARRRGRLHELRDLQRLGIVVARAAPFILLANGRRPVYQLNLF